MGDPSIFSHRSTYGSAPFWSVESYVMPSRLSRFRRPLIFWGCRMLTLRLSDRSISLFIMYYPLSRALIGYISRSPELLYQTMFISRFYDALSLSKSILGNIPNLSQSSLEDFGKPKIYQNCVCDLGFGFWSGAKWASHDWLPGQAYSMNSKHRAINN